MIRNEHTIQEIWLKFNLFFAQALLANIASSGRFAYGLVGLSRTSEVAMSDTVSMPNRVTVRKRYAQLLEEYDEHDQLLMRIERLGDDSFQLRLQGKQPVRGRLRDVLEHIDRGGRAPIIQLFSTEDPSKSPEVHNHFSQHTFELH
jgi:hypothetical protein